MFCFLYYIQQQMPQANLDQAGILSLVQNHASIQNDIASLKDLDLTVI